MILTTINESYKVPYNQAKQRGVRWLQHSNYPQKVSAL